MEDLLLELTESCDMVVIDSTPLLTVSDSMPLLRAVSGIVLVGRINRTSREALARLRFVVESAGGHALGVVATGARRGGLYVAPGYGYEVEYSGAEDAHAAGSSARGRVLGLIRRDRSAGDEIGASDSS
jgi:Mrp family chromosome partitioning ATPase